MVPEFEIKENNKITEEKCGMSSEQFRKDLRKEVF